MELEVNDCVEKGNSSQQMDEDVFKKHVKMLKRKYTETIREVEKYTAREIDQKRLKKMDQVVKVFLDQVKKVLLQLDVNLDKEKLHVVSRFGFDIMKMQAENVIKRTEECEVSRSIKEEKSEVDSHKVEALNQDVKKVNVGECLVKAEEQSCKDERVAVPNCSAISADVKGSAMSDDKVVTEAVKSVKDDWNYRHSMWWLNFRRKIIYDKIRS